MLLFPLFLAKPRGSFPLLKGCFSNIYSFSIYYNSYPPPAGVGYPTSIGAPLHTLKPASFTVNAFVFVAEFEIRLPVTNAD
ncbi:MAG: hypothetical protein C4308_11650 [Chitinophagaceae bacterium]